MSEASAVQTIPGSDQRAIFSALRREWLLTNGLGGYAMGSAAGVNTRRYHGWLVASLRPPVQRIVALHSMIEQLQIGESIFHLATQQFEGGLLHPDGHTHLRGIVHNVPGTFTWTFNVQGMAIQRQLTVIAGENAAELTYRFENVPENVVFRARPLTPMRDFHGLCAEGHRVPRVQPHGRAGLLLELDDASMLLTAMCAPGWKLEPQWWRGFEYAQDRERGQDCREDLWSPGTLEAHIPAGARHEFTVRVHVSTSAQRKGSMLSAPPGQHAVTAPQPLRGPSERLRHAASQFIVSRRQTVQGSSNWSVSVIAGYPWFADWGRDTMISLPGLMLVAGRLEEARSTLHTFARHLRNGLVPNHFDDYGGAAHYNTVDASLWFVHAVHELWRALCAGGQTQGPAGGEFDAELLNACREILRAYREGTDFNIFMDDDGLIAAGDSGTQLTWMDARRDGVTFTPRHGKPVEINALWHNALRCLAQMSHDDAERKTLTALASRVASAFQQFWRVDDGCLHDVLTPQVESASRRGAIFVGDGRVRPNQIFAVSLPFSPLTREQQESVVRTVRERLLTPFGLRTLDPDDPMYRGRFEGDLFRRDAAYHQGTVWPWLIGAYAEAALKVGDFSEDARRHVRSVLKPLIDELDAHEHGCFGQLAEVYDGDAPHRPAGCPAQAWSVAEVLRAMTLLDQRQP